MTVRLLTAEEVAAMIGVSTDWIHAEGGGNPETVEETHRSTSVLQEDAGGSR